MKSTRSRSLKDFSHKSLEILFFEKPQKLFKPQSDLLFSSSVLALSSSSSPAPDHEDIIFYHFRTLIRFWKSLRFPIVRNVIKLTWNSPYCFIFRLRFLYGTGSSSDGCKALSVNKNLDSELKSN